MDANNLYGCINREVPRPKRKRRFTGCGVIIVDSTLVKTWFRIEAGRIPPMQKVIVPNDISISLVRKGSEDVVAEYNAFSVDNDNNISFYWDGEFLNQPPGLYTGDVFFSANYCLSVQFKIPRCEAVITQCRNEYGQLCGSDCADSACIDASIQRDVIDTDRARVDECFTLFGIDCE